MSHQNYFGLMSIHNGKIYIPMIVKNITDQIVVLDTSLFLNESINIKSEHIQFYNLNISSDFILLNETHEIIADKNLIFESLDDETMRAWNWINDPVPPENEASNF